MYTTEELIKNALSKNSMEISKFENSHSYPALFIIDEKHPGYGWKVLNGNTVESHKKEIEEYDSTLQLVIANQDNCHLQKQVSDGETDPDYDCNTAAAYKVAHTLTADNKINVRTWSETHKRPTLMLMDTEDDGWKICAGSVSALMDTCQYLTKRFPGRKFVVFNK